MLAVFAINNKVHSTTKVFLFILNYGRELRMEVDLRRKRKIEKVIEFVERIRKVQKEVEVVLKRAQEKMKRQMDKKRRKRKYRE